ncbi:hypothetical protein AAG614_15310 [Citromicrobium bathyomarinum]
MSWPATLALTAMALSPVTSQANELDEFEHEDFPACSVDGGSWAGEPRTARYVETSFDDLDAQFDQLLDDLDSATGAAPGMPRDQWPTRFERLQIQAQSNIVWLGRLLPRMDRPLDLAPMIGQFAKGEIWLPRGGHHTEFVRVALAQEFATEPTTREAMANFLLSLELVEARLLDLKYADVINPDEGVRALDELGHAARELRAEWEALSPAMQRLIFDDGRPEGARSLSERLQTRVVAICEAYSDCGGDEDCGRDETSDGLTGEPMEAL